MPLPTGKMTAYLLPHSTSEEGVFRMGLWEVSQASPEFDSPSLYVVAALLGTPGYRLRVL